MDFSEFDLKVRCDDELAVYSDGVAVHDTYAVGGSQWNIVYDVKLTSDLVVFKASNGVSKDFV